MDHRGLGPLACCSHELRGRVYSAWPACADALVMAVGHGNLLLLRSQLEASTGRVDEPDTYADTALSDTATYGQNASVRALLVAGAEVTR